MRRFDWPRRALLGACVLFLPMFAYAETSSWSAWLASQIQQHPEVLAAREQLLGSNASADALEQPLYNPELSTDLERNGEEDNYRVGVQQTIDWWDRRGARRQQAGFMRSAAEALVRARHHVLAVRTHERAGKDELRRGAERARTPRRAPPLRGQPSAPH